MISGLIHVPEPAQAESIDLLADTLSALVEGVAAGLVADAVIVSRRPDPALSTVAEGAGARLATTGLSPSPWHAAARLARREWVLCLQAGDIPQEGWIRTLDRFVHSGRPDIVLGRLRRAKGVGGALTLLDGLIGVGQPRAGDLVRRERLVDGSPFRPRLRPRALQARIVRG